MWRESSGALSAVPRKVLLRWNATVSSVITRVPPEQGQKARKASSACNCRNSQVPGGWGFLANNAFLD